MKVAKLAAILLVALLVGCVTTASEWSSPEAEVQAYLKAEVAEYREIANKTGGEPPTNEIKRLVKPPTVRVMPKPSVTEEDADSVREAVAILNDALPPSFQVKYDPDKRWWYANFPDPTLEKVMSRLTDENISIVFMPREEWPKGKNRHKTVAAGFPVSIDIMEPHRITGGLVLVDKKRAKRESVPMTAIILHEMLHIFGRRHPDARLFPDSLMRHDRPVKGEYPYLRPLDVRVMQAVYGGVE